MEEKIKRLKELRKEIIEENNVDYDIAIFYREDDRFAQLVTGSVEFRVNVGVETLRKIIQEVKEKCGENVAATITKSLINMITEETKPDDILN